VAKAKKPTPGSKSSSTVSKDVGVKADSKATKTESGALPDKTTKSSAAAKAGAVSPNKTASTASKTAEPAKVASAPTTSSIPKTAKPDVAGKTEQTVESKKPDGTVKPDSKPAETSKSVEQKPVVKDVKPVASPPHQSSEQKASVFWPLVFGGVIAGGLGFLASEMNVFQTRADTDGINQTLNSQAERIATLESAEAPVVELPDLQGVQSSIAALSETVSALEARLTDFENRPAPSGENSGVSAEYAEDLAALQSSVEAQKNEISRLLENALSVEEATANAARAAQAQQALTAITAALGTGAGFETAVQDLTASGVENIPAALSENANGVTPLLTLQTTFPDTARGALSVARAGGGDETAGGVGAFLKRQLGARSVAPREGDDADAVLSRAEAAVREGRVADALTEIETLPAPVQEAMTDWLASARARAATEAAVQDLSQRLTAN
jgi:hypothetical protein